MTVLAKTRIVHTRTEFNFIAAVDRHTQYLSISSVSSVKCQQVCFYEGHFVNPPNSWLEQWHPWRVPFGQWGPGLACSADYMWPTIVSLATVWVPWLLMGCPKQWFLPPHLPHPIPLHPTLPPILPTPFIINTDGRKGQQEIQWNSAIRDREGYSSYNKSQ